MSPILKRAIRKRKRVWREAGKRYDPIMMAWIGVVIIMIGWLVALYAVEADILLSIQMILLGLWLAIPMSLVISHSMERMMYPFKKKRPYFKKMMKYCFAAMVLWFIVVFGMALGYIPSF